MNYTWQVLHEAKLCSLCTAWITPVIQSVKTPAIACRATQNRVVDSDWWKWFIHGPFVWPNEHVGFVVFISYTLLLLYCFIALLFVSFTWDTVHELYLLSLKLSGVKLLGTSQLYHLDLRFSILRDHLFHPPSVGHYSIKQNLLPAF